MERTKNPSFFRKESNRYRLTMRAGHWTKRKRSSCSSFVLPNNERYKTEFRMISCINSIRKITDKGKLSIETETFELFLFFRKSFIYAQTPSITNKTPLSRKHRQSKSETFLYISLHRRSFSARPTWMTPPSKQSRRLPSSSKKYNVQKLILLICERMVCQRARAARKKHATSGCTERWKLPSSGRNDLWFCFHRFPTYCSLSFPLPPMHLTGSVVNGLVVLGKCYPSRKVFSDQTPRIH